jgi:hypothetical protein
MRACVCVCVYVCIYVCMYVSIYVCMYVGIYVCMYVGRYICMYVRMDVLLEKGCSIAVLRRVFKELCGHVVSQSWLSLI